ncbi:MAG: sigma-70 family RNA polymerase sigma factor [Eubacteriales bacterium]|nr:sigma-70 family RNA polymerase sigma factor [Eubacteriales bacterium]
MEPHSHEEHIRHTFDAFCKKVLRNEARDYLDELARQRNREISFSDLPVEVMEQLSVCDYYFADDRTFDVLGNTVQIASDELAEAIAALPKQKRDIILLSYFLDMPDGEIAKALNMVRSSVAYRRSATLKLLRELMGGKADEQ